MERSFVTCKAFCLCNFWSLCPEGIFFAVVTADQSLVRSNCWSFCFWERALANRAIIQAGGPVPALWMDVTVRRTQLCCGHFSRDDRAASLLYWGECLCLSLPLSFSVSLWGVGTTRATVYMWKSEDEDDLECQSSPSTFFDHPLAHHLVL